MWDSVPWFIGGGAEHSPEVARLLAYAATGGAEGVVGPADLKVSPLAVPGGGVRVAAGSALVLNHAAGGAAQTYAARNPTVDTVSIAPTGSAGGRTDLIVAQIEDPFLAGEPWDEPANPRVGPYVFTRVIPNVPAGTTRLRDVAGYAGRSAIVLARVTLPASTGTVTAAMVTDLRKVAQPRQDRKVGILASSVNDRRWLNPTTPVLFPDRALSVDVPEWATRVVVSANLAGLLQFYGNADMNGFLRLGTGVGAVDGQVFNQVLEADAADKQRTSLAFSMEVTVPAAMRGTTQPLGLYAQRNTDKAGRFGTDGASRLLLDATFTEAAV